MAHGTGYAFPLHGVDGPISEGMTLRDYFAAQVIVGFLPGAKVEDNYVKHFAKRAYQIADAMIEARASQTSG